MNTVAIVGRPNVGKSTFFNRLIGERVAIMDNEPGVTRDRHYGKAEWIGHYFTIIDTGGYVEGSDDIFEGAIRKQVKLALEEADVVLFMVDTREGLHPLDREFANVLRKIKKPLIIMANKADTHAKAADIPEFYALGLDAPIFPISSQTGAGTGELLDEVVSHFPEIGIEDEFEGLPRIAIVGRPNVGKSSLLNVFLGIDRAIVTDIAGTTRDAIDTKYTMFGKEFVITDTAGIRRKAKITEDIEYYSILRSMKALEKSDVCIVMLDATRGLEAQDANIISMAHQNKKGIVMLVNKWDLMEKETNTARDFEDKIRQKMAPLDYFPIIFTSTVTKQRVFQAMEKALEVYENKMKRIPTSQLNDLILHDIKNTPPPSSNGRMVHIKYLTQLPSKSPSFALFCNLPKEIAVSYERFIENRMREHFGFEGVAISLFFRKK